MKESVSSEIKASTSPNLDHSSRDTDITDVSPIPPTHVT